MNTNLLFLTILLSITTAYALKKFFTNLVNSMQLITVLFTIQRQQKLVE